MSIISIAGVKSSQSGYEYPDYQEKIEQLQSKIENLQAKVGKASDGVDSAEAKQQRLEMIRSQITQMQTQIQRLETMEGKRNQDEVSAEVIEATKFAPGSTDAAEGEKKDQATPETKLDILV